MKPNQLTDWVFLLYAGVPLVSYIHYTRRGKLKTWVRIPSPVQKINKRKNK